MVMRWSSGLLLLLLAFGAAGADPAPAPAPAPAANLPAPAAPAGSARVNARTKAVAKVLPAVVNISTERVVTQTYSRFDTLDLFPELSPPFFGMPEQQYKTISLGSGVVVDRQGLVLTNEHVIRKASRIIIGMMDGTSFEAVTVATDPNNDLALVRIEGLEKGQELAAVEFARPDDLLLGEEVIAIGNPFGFGHSVSAGVLSAAGRKFVVKGKVVFDDILQTDSAINPGNSGGPLLNMDGELIGINTAVQAKAEGIGFAIPVKRLEEALAIWLIPSRFGLNECGLVPGTRVLENGETAVFVREVQENSPAATAGLKPGQGIKSFAGKPVRQAIEISRQLWTVKAGDIVTLGLDDGKTITLKVAKLPELSGEELARQKLGLELQELTPRLADALHLPYHRGLVVSDVTKNSALDRRGVQRGDVIIQVGEAPVASFTELYRALGAIRHGDVVPLILHRIQYSQGMVLLRRYAVELTF